MEGVSYTLEPGQTLSLRVDLKYEIAKVLVEIMEDRKFQSYAEAVRFCIVEISNQAEFRLPDPYLNQIHKCLQTDYVRNQERIFGVIDFIQEALDNYFTEIRQNTTSLLSFEVRDNLSPEDLDIALEFIACQEESSAEQVTVETLAKKMDKRNLAALQEKLDSFVNRGILSRMTHNGTIYYHAKKVNKF